MAGLQAQTSFPPSHVLRRGVGGGEGPLAGPPRAGRGGEARASRLPLPICPVPGWLPPSPAASPHGGRGDCAPGSLPQQKPVCTGGAFSLSPCRPGRGPPRPHQDSEGTPRAPPYRTACQSHPHGRACPPSPPSPRVGKRHGVVSRLCASSRRGSGAEREAADWHGSELRGTKPAVSVLAV